MKASISDRKEQEQKLLKQNELFVKEHLRNTGEQFFRNKGAKPNPLSGVLQAEDFALYQLVEISHEGKAPRKEAFENILSALRIPGMNFVYLIVGDDKGVKLYFGLARDLNYGGKSTLPSGVTAAESAQKLLRPNILGNFRGSKIEEANGGEVQNQISQFSQWGMIEGVPKLLEEKDGGDFQGVDRLIRIMQGDNYCISIVATAIPSKDVGTLEEYLCRLHNIIAPLGKRSLQISDSLAENEGASTGSSSSETKGSSGGTSHSKTKTSGTNKGDTDGWGKSDQNNGNSTNGSVTKGESWSTANADTANKGTSESKQKGTSENVTTGKNHTEGNNLSVEYTEKYSQEWLKYLDESLFPRLNYSKNKGAFHTFISVAADDNLTFMKLRNTIQALFSAEMDSRSPLNLCPGEFGNFVQNFQYPYYDAAYTKEEFFACAAISQTVVLRNTSQNNAQMSGNKSDSFPMGYWLSAEDLAFVPQKEVAGLALREEVEFGLNPAPQKELDSIALGHLIQSGNETTLPIHLNKQVLSKHTFVSGVTGSGKTTTCLKILVESNLPFLVIEPAKTEYRVLCAYYDDLQVFTLGNSNVAPFLLNPFEFLPSETIVSRVDLIKASIEAAFDMEAAIPQIIEAALYQCYEQYGWNINTNRNTRFADPFAEGTFAFPTLEDLMRNVTKVTEEQGFDQRLKDDYIGSIRARLQSLMVGAKGAMLNTPRSVNFRQLLEQKTVIELEEIKSPSEKSLIMGFLLINLNAALKAHYEESRINAFQHITLIEEAHRLLSRVEPGDHPSKKQGVEALCDMLAEVRKYGESLIIADQIPNKLASDVLKNTNTKIVHKIFARDDKEAIGNIMALEDEQKDFFSFLEVGRAIVLSEGYSQPVQVQVQPVEGISTTRDQGLSTEETRRKIFESGQQFLIDSAHLLFPGYTALPETSQEAVRQLPELLFSRDLKQKWIAVAKNNKLQKNLESLSEFLRQLERDGIQINAWLPAFAQIILHTVYAIEETDEAQEKRQKAIEKILACIASGGDIGSLRNDWVRVELKQNPKTREQQEKLPSEKE